jgi:hypothetical protein
MCTAEVTRYLDWKSADLQAHIALDSNPEVAQLAPAFASWTGRQFIEADIVAELQQLNVCSCRGFGSFPMLLLQLEPKLVVYIMDMQQQLRLVRAPAMGSAQATCHKNQLLVDILTAQLEAHPVTATDGKALEKQQAK